MAETYNADEVFEMAEQIEREGVHFYKAAAKNAETKESKKFLNDLANMEAAHLATFKEMRRQLAQDEHEMLFDPDEIVARYLDAMVKGRVFDNHPEHDSPLHGLTKLKDILKVAIAAENTSIAFYFGILQSIRADEDKKAVKAILNQEMKHVTMLNEHMIAL